MIASAIGATIVDNSPADWPEGAKRVINFEHLPNGAHPRLLINATTRWLHMEGFTEASGDYSERDVVLTAKALTAMNASPESLDRTLGAKLTDAVKASGSEIGRSMI